jgi:hypothetical protein
MFHSFSAYDELTKGYCFFWKENDGNLTMSEFSSIIILLMKRFKKHNVHQILKFFSTVTECNIDNQNSNAGHDKSWVPGHHGACKIYHGA